MHMQSVSATSIYFCLPDENTKEATKSARPRTRGMPTMKPQQNKRLRTKHEPTNETTSRVKGRKNAEQYLRPDRQRQHRFHGCRPQPVRFRQGLLHLVQEGFQQVVFQKVFINASAAVMNRSSSRGVPIYLGPSGDKSKQIVFTRRSIPQVVAQTARPCRQSADHCPNHLSRRDNGKHQQF